MIYNMRIEVLGPSSPDGWPPDERASEQTSGRNPGRTPGTFR